MHLPNGYQAPLPRPRMAPGVCRGTDGATWSHRGPWDRWLCDPRIVRAVHLENTLFSVIFGHIVGRIQDRVNAQKFTVGRLIAPRGQCIVCFSQRFNQWRTFDRQSRAAYLVTNPRRRAPDHTAVADAHHNNGLHSPCCDVGKHFLLR